MKFIVFGTHEYQWALWPFSMLFKKYWGEHQIIYVGDRLAGDLPEGLEFMQVPCYKEGIWPWKHWFGNGVKETLKVFEDDLIALFLPDHWMRCPANLNVIEALIRFMSENGKTVRGNLSDDTGLETHGKAVTVHDGVEIIVCGDTHHCGKEAAIAFSPAIWNRELLIKILEPHWGLWGAEQHGSVKMRDSYPDLISVGTRPPALRRVNAIRDGRQRQRDGRAVKEVWLDGLSEEDRQIVREMIPKRVDVIE